MQFVSRAKEGISSTEELRSQILPGGFARALSLTEALRIVPLIIIIKRRIREWGIRGRAKCRGDEIEW